MGEYSDMMIDGTLDAETGEILDRESPGYPRVRRNGRIVGQFHDSIQGMKCPECGRRCKGEIGIAAHRRAKHSSPGG